MTSSDAAITEAPHDIHLLGERLGHGFSDLGLLTRAVTHPSAAASKAARRDGTANYERLEFLGDRVLGLLIADLLMVRYPREDEGALAKRHAAVVRQEALAEVAASIGLAAFLVMAKAEDDAGQRQNPALLSNACEAVIAALYLDGGLDAARHFVVEHWMPLITADVEPPRDAKTSLQEWAQGRGLPLPNYREVARDGPAHDPTFTMEVEVQGQAPAEGRGGSKRQAEQLAAETLLARLMGVSK